MTAGGSNSVEVGDRAPDFVLQTQAGEELRLSDYLGKKVVVLFFYPKDGTSICTKEVCAFRDAYDQFVAAGAVVIGVSGDSAERHASFAAEHRLQFRLGVDPQNALRKQYGAARVFGLLPGRVTFVIDKSGMIRMVFSALLSADSHVTEALATVRQLAEA